jgi:hypothetical protein
MVAHILYRKLKLSGSWGAQYWILFRHLKMVFVVAHFGKTPYMTRPNSLLIRDLAFGLGRRALLTSLTRCAKPEQRQSSSCEYYLQYVTNVTNPLRFIKKDFSALSQITVRWNTRLTRCPTDIFPALCRYAVRYHSCVVRRPHCCFTVRSSSRQSQSYYWVGLNSLFLPLLMLILTTRTNALVNTLIVYAINRCLLTSYVS